MKRVVICTGGSAGHLFPAQELAAALSGEAELLFLGSGLSTTPFFSRDRFQWKEIPSGRSSLKGLVKVAWGMVRAQRALRRFNPDLVVGFGSYHSLPPLLACRLLKIPYILHAADSVPGRVIRLFASRALVTGIHFPPAERWLKGGAKLVAMPLRSSPANGDKGRAELLAEWGLAADRKTLLVFGGSQGARRINQLLCEAAPQLAHLPLQILHMTGDPEATGRLRLRYEEVRLPARVVDFEPQMASAWRCADLVISRSGASSLAEQVAWAVPGLLIPYPHAADDHQLHNARYLAEVAGVAVAEEASLTGELLARAVAELIERLPERRAQMEGYRSLRRENFIDLVRSYLNG